MADKKTHWKKLFDYRYLSAEELQKDVVLTIKEIKRDEEMFNQADQSMVKKPVVYFKETTKGVVLNPTNAKGISKALGTAYQEDWVGKKVKLYPAMVRAFGENVLAIRITGENEDISAMGKSKNITGSVGK